MQRRKMGDEFGFSASGLGCWRMFGSYRPSKVDGSEATLHRAERQRKIDILDHLPRCQQPHLGGCPTPSLLHQVQDPHPS